MKKLIIGLLLLLIGCSQEPFLQEDNICAVYYCNGNVTLLTYQDGQGVCLCECKDGGIGVYAPAPLLNVSSQELSRIVRVQQQWAAMCSN